MSKVGRRHFLMSSMALPAVLTTRVQLNANNRVRVGIVGFNGRGRAHLQAYTKIPNVEIAALCDIDETVMDRGQKMVQSSSAHRPSAYADIRRLLDDKTIDAVSIASPNFHHTLQSIWAMQAGKDVLVEKPCSYNMFEAQQLIAASRKYNRIVQDGTGASASLHEAKRRLKEGIIGDVYMARALCFKWRDTIGRAKEEPPPAGVDYDLWIGPARVRPFTKNRFHYNWHWQWEYGNGDLGNQGAHQMHAARSVLGVRYPTKISAIGGHVMFDDDQETPNVLTATYEFDEGGKKKILVFDVRHWITNNEAGMGERADPGGPAAGQPDTIGDIWYGSKGYLTTGRGGFQTFLGREHTPGPKVRGRAGGRRLRQLHRRGAQPQARGPARRDRGRRDLDHARPSGEHLVPGRPDVVFRSGDLHLQGGCGSHRDVHPRAVPRAVRRAEDHRVERVLSRFQNHWWRPALAGPWRF